MINRKVLKDNAKKIFHSHYWALVGGYLIFGLIIFLISSGFSGYFAKWNVLFNFEAVEKIRSLLFRPALLTTVLGIFVGLPIEVGMRRYALENRKGRVDFGRALPYGFSHNYGNVILVLFLRQLLVSLWSLLFVVPGIVKAYQYRLVRYLVAENPDIPCDTALNRSKALMDGHKMDAFVLDLSFIGWFLLSGLTCGIVGVFWVNPYYRQTDAEFYAAIIAQQPDDTQSSDATTEPLDEPASTDGAVQ
jgi:hypothetical protein